MANWFEVRAGTMTEAEARAYFGRPTIRSRWPAQAVVELAGLPSITDRDEVIARHGDPEIVAIPLMIRNEISF